jgi:arylsulfatase A
MMNRREFIKMAGCAAAASALAQSGSASKPNIIFILADELGIGNVSCYGADNFKTPNIDQFAREGTRYTHCYTAPLCGPSAALILTGRYAFRTGATSQDATKLMKPSVETMMPTYLKTAGYVTASLGKWGQLPIGPAEFGFDEHLSTHDLLVDFIIRHRADPFYVYYSISNLQKPILPTPDSKPDSTDFFADNISYMDKLVGKLVAELERLKLRDNTLIVFTADHGTGGVYAEESTIGGRRLAGEKGSMLEGGALVPMIVNWPGKTPAGKISADLVDSTDFVPTFAELAGAKLPLDKVLDGHSFAPQVLGRHAKPRDWIFIELGRDWYLREAGWKLNRSGRLFDMTHSPFEEPLVPADTQDPAAIAARQRLEAALDKLNPAGGIMDEGDGTGRHAGRLVHSKKNLPPPQK